jgi:hypothetical protein
MEVFFSLVLFIFVTPPASAATAEGVVEVATAVATIVGVAVRVGAARVCADDDISSGELPFLTFI